MKKRIIGLMVLCLVVALTGCGTVVVEDNGGQISGVGAVKSNSKVVKLMSGNYYMKYSGELEGQKMTIEVTKKDGKIAAKIESDGSTMRAITTDDYVYTVMDDQKWYIKADRTEEEELDDFDFGVDLDETTMASGKEIVDGVEYYYEEFEGTKFYFLKDDLKMIVSEDETVTVEESSTKSKDELFDIPTDYEELSFSTEE